MQSNAEPMDTNIRVNTRTRDQLADIGKYGDSMDDIVKRLIVSFREYEDLKRRGLVISKDAYERDAGKH